MSEEKDNGGTAFPIVHPDGTGVQYWGLTVRDYFAAKAMLGMANGDYACSDLAEYAYKIADAMLEARKQ